MSPQARDRALSVGCGSILAAAAVAVLFPVFVHAPSGGGRSCLSNLHHIGIALSLYSEDNDQRLPSAARWMDVRWPYLTDESTYKCPALTRTRPAAYGYAFNASLTQRPLKTVPRPDATPLVYDSANLARNAFDPVSSLPRPGRHSRRNCIQFVDGHTKAMPDSADVPPFPN